MGKSFLLDISFWLLTGQWPGNRVAIPERDAARDKPTITYQVGGKNGKPEPKTAKYSFHTSPARPKGPPATPALVIYATVDGGFTVWDPARNYWRRTGSEVSEEPRQPRAYHFTPGSLADGLREDGGVFCKGLIEDWVNWYYQRSSSSSSESSSSSGLGDEDGSSSSEFGDQEDSSSGLGDEGDSSSSESGEPSPNTFEVLEDVIAQLSHPQERMSPAAPVRVFLNDTREYPVLQLPYGKVAYPHWPAGVKRIVGLAYLLVWSWHEHMQAAELRHEKPTDRIILLVDEIESHLHPKWQRTIVPALLRVTEELRRPASGAGGNGYALAIGSGVTRTVLRYGAGPPFLVRFAITRRPLQRVSGQFKATLWAGLPRTFSAWSRPGRGRLKRPSRRRKRSCEARPRHFPKACARKRKSTGR